MYTIVGLGNPGDEYKNTRHNTGRIVLKHFMETFNFSDLKDSAKYLALFSEGKIKKEKVMVLFPETFMNKSGSSVKTIITNQKKAENLIVVYDDLDLPIGSIKISYNRGSGGHRGLESIIRALKTEKFIRIRVGISPQTPSGKLKKPRGDREVDKHIIGEFKPQEVIILKKISKKVLQAIELIIIEGKEVAMSLLNS